MGDTGVRLKSKLREQSDALSAMCLAYILQLEKDVAKTTARRAHTLARKQVVAAEDAAHVLACKTEAQRVRRLRDTFKQVIAQEAEAHGLTVSTLMSPSRAMARLRQQAIWRIVTEMGGPGKVGWSELGRLFGNDHTTVRYGYYRVARQRNSGGVSSASGSMIDEDNTDVSSSGSCGSSQSCTSSAAAP